MALGLARGLDMQGVDTFEYNPEGWQATLAPQAAGRIHKITQGPLPFGDGTFDFVISNQVFEHVRDPGPPLADIHRVLRPGGRFLAMFPSAETWYEEHTKLYFAHWLADWPKTQSAYVGAMLRLGLANRAVGAGDVPRKDYLMRALREGFYPRRLSEISALWRKAFGAPPQSIAGDLLRERLRLRGGRFSAPPPVFDPLLSFISRARLGEALLVAKAG